MSRGLVCDHCDVVLLLNSKGEADSGEDAAWLRITTGAFATGWDACSRSCAVQLIEEGPIGPVLDAELQVISEIARTIAADRAEDEDDD